MGAADRYRRSPRARAWGVSGAVAVLAGMVAILVAAPGHAPRPQPAQRAMTLFEVKPSPSPAKATQQPKAEPPQRDAAPKPLPRSEMRRTPPTSAETEAKPMPQPQIPAQPRVQSLAPRVAPPVPQAQPAPPPPPVRDTGAVRDAYAAMLWQRIAARRPHGVHIPGTARIAFRLNRDGSMASVSLESPSGNAMLDKLALRTVRRAAPFPAPPPALGNALAFTIDFHFD